MVVVKHNVITPFTFFLLPILTIDMLIIPVLVSSGIIDSFKRELWHTSSIFLGITSSVLYLILATFVSKKQRLSVFVVYISIYLVFVYLYEKGVTLK
jgi:hypothetical protein